MAYSTKQEIEQEVKINVTKYTKKEGKKKRLKDLVISTCKILKSDIL